MKYPELRYKIGTDVCWNGTCTDTNTARYHYESPHVVTIFLYAYEDNGEPYYRGNVVDDGGPYWSFTDADIDHEKTAELNKKEGTAS